MRLGRDQTSYRSDEIEAIVLPIHYTNKSGEATIINSKL